MTNAFYFVKKAFSFSRYTDFYISLFPSFFTCQPLLEKMKLSLSDVINWLDKNLKINFVWYLEKKSRSGIRTWSVDRVLNKAHFYGENLQRFEICSFVCSIKFAVSILVNSPKQVPLKIRYFERRLSKNILKVNLIFSFAPSPFLRTRLWKTKGACN